MLKERYEPFMDLMKQTYDRIYDDEKHEFSYQDAVYLILFSITLDSLCEKINKEIEKED